MCFHSICKVRNLRCRRPVITPLISSGGRSARNAPGRPQKGSGPVEARRPALKRPWRRDVIEKTKTVPHGGISRRRQKNHAAPEAPKGKSDATSPTRLRPETGRRNFLRTAPTPIISAQKIAHTRPPPHNAAARTADGRSVAAAVVAAVVLVFPFRVAGGFRGALDGFCPFAPGGLGILGRVKYLLEIRRQLRSVESDL